MLEDEKGERCLKRLLDGKILILQPLTDVTADIVADLIDRAKQFIADKDDFIEVVLDLSNVNIIDSTGISFIVGLYKSVKKINRGFRVEGVNNDIKKIFSLMKLDEVFMYNKV